MRYLGSTSFIIIFSLLLLVSCSYNFVEPPFQSTELVKISETDFGKQVLSKLDHIPDTEQTKDIKEGLSEESLVYEISDNFLIQQDENDENTGWELNVLTKNNHHIVMCSLMTEENGDIELPQNVEMKESEDGTIYFSGEQAELKALALELALSGPKLCIAVPYADPSTSDDLKISDGGKATPEPGVVKEVVREVPVEVVKEVIVEVPVEVIIEKEVVREVTVEVEKQTNVQDENEGGGGACGSKSGTMLAGHYAMIALPFALSGWSRVWRVRRYVSRPIDVINPL